MRRLKNALNLSLDTAEIGEGVHAAGKNCRGLSVVMQGRGQIAPLHRERVDRGLPAFFVCSRI